MKNNDLSILLVEDDEVDVMNVKRAFKKHNIVNSLYVANDGLEALAILRDEDGEKIDPLPRVILLDVNMPKMNGIELLQVLRQDPKLRCISVFMLTTSNEERDKIAAYELNVAGYILKPVELDDFMTAISTLKLYWSLIEMPGSEYCV